eukprot:TRINITY_DN14541_c0_g3_i3.p1 TRINITY_DN14541_c0_g3~~TRINITY_DN14541_c0_g3_i3.p1  ORF type:complete len:1093 (-),score=272.98 TRINITY_DN14541_c0_g3_i3:141-3419(-)
MQQPYGAGIGSAPAYTYGGPAASCFAAPVGAGLARPAAGSAPGYGPPVGPTYKGHILAQFFTEIDGYVCNECGMRLPRGSLMFGCRQLNFDLCPRCAQQQPAGASGGAAPSMMGSQLRPGSLDTQGAGGLGQPMSHAVRPGSLDGGFGQPQAQARHGSLDSMGRPFSGQIGGEILPPPGQAFAGASARGSAFGQAQFNFQAQPGRGLSSPCYVGSAAAAGSGTVPAPAPTLPQGALQPPTHAFEFTADPPPQQPGLVGGAAAGPADGFPKAHVDSGGGLSLAGPPAAGSAANAGMNMAGLGSLPARDGGLTPGCALHDASPYPGATPHNFGPPVPSSKQDRPTWRDTLCDKAFAFVDSLQTGYLNVNQNKTGLTLVLQWLGDVPMPKDSWFHQVFKNFADQNQGEQIDLPNFKEIVTQWDEHHLRKKAKKAAAEAEAAELGGQLHQTPVATPGGANGSTSLPPGAAPVSSAPPPPPRAAPRSTAQQPAQQASVVQPPLQQQQPQQPPQQQPQAQQQAYVGDAATGVSPISQAVRERGSTDSLQALTTTTISDPSMSSSPSKRTTSAAASSKGAAAEMNPELLFPTYVGRLAIFDDYEFFGDVGQGAFGKVMVVRHRTTRSLRACKVAAVQTAQARELIDTEIKLLKALNHPNIMKMHEVYLEHPADQRVSSGNIYIVTELCEGGDLFSRITHHYERLKKPMTESHVAFMMQQILSATQYCHEKGIIHRDMKPENILFVDRSSHSPLKIIDFGLANFTDKIRETAKEVKIPRSGTLGKIAKMLPTIGGKHIIPHHERKRVMQRAGTAHYMAPEMIEADYDTSADMFSIGIILCQLLTGWHPFYVANVDNEQSVRAKISSPEPVVFPVPIWESVSDDAKQLCKLLLEKNPTSRITAAKSLEHPWFRDPSKTFAFGNVEVLTFSIFEGLVKYQAYSKLKRAVLQLLTRELSEFQIQELRSKFMALDAKGDGLLSPEELVEGMRHVGYNMTEDELRKVVSSLDGSGAQRIGYREFISALIERRVTFDRQQLRECFKKFDVRGVGKISYDDVKRAVCPAITESDWQEISAQLPGGAKDKLELDFDEFVLLMEAGGDD